MDESVGKEKSWFVDFPTESDVRLTVKCFKGKMYIDLRDYFPAAEGRKPTKRGVTLTTEGAGRLKGLFAILDEDKDMLQVFG